MSIISRKLDSIAASVDYDICIFPDYTEALVGYVTDTKGKIAAAYDYDTCIEITAHNIDETSDETKYEAASEYFSYNVLGAHIGNNPVFVSVQDFQEMTAWEIMEEFQDMVNPEDDMNVIPEYDYAIVGYTERFGESPALLLSYTHIESCLMATEGLTDKEASEKIKETTTVNTETPIYILHEL